jgi:hypothetical protein
MTSSLFDLTGRVAVVSGTLIPMDGGNLAMNAGGSHTW